MARRPKNRYEGFEILKNGSCRRAEVINGKRKYFTAATPEEVWDKIRNAREVERLKAEEEVRIASMGALFSDVAEDYKKEILKMKLGTQKSYLPAFDRCIDKFGEYRMKEIEPYMVSEWLKSLNYAATTVSNTKTVLNNIYQHWIESPKWRGDGENIAKMATMPKGLKRGKRQPPTDEQVKIVKDNYLDPDALLPVAYLCTGERRGEMCAIQLRDIDFENKIINITKSIEHDGNTPILRHHTKTEAGIRQVPLLPMLEEALKPYRRMPKDTYIIGLQKTPVTYTKYKYIWERFWRKHGQAIPETYQMRRTVKGIEKTINCTRWKIPVCGHQFRHEYVCQLCMAGVPIEVAILLVGHANDKMIRDVYLSLKPKMLDDVREKLSRSMKNL